MGKKKTQGAAKLAAMSELRHKASRAAFFMIFRQAAMNLVNFAGQVALARVLMPSDFGIYFIILFVINFLTYVGDGGLGSALIRKPGKVSERAIDAVFSFQQVVMAGIAVLLLIASFFAGGLFADRSTIWLIRISIVSYYLVSFRIIPVMMMERKLSFARIAALEVIEVVAFQATAVTLALMHKGVFSLIAGLAVKNICMLLFVFFFARFKPRFKWNFRLIKPILPFGLSFQGVHFVNMAKDSFIPVVIAPMLGTASVGLINWATSVANYPLLASAILSRVLFPLFSKLQQDKEKFSRVLNTTVRLNALLIAGFSCVILSLSGPITHIIYTDKWASALVLFKYFIPINFILAAIYPLVAAFNAMGRAGYNFRYSFVWAGTMWLLSVFLVPKFGIAGFGMANLLMNLTSFKYMADAARDYGFKPISALFAPVAAFCLTVPLIQWLAGMHPVKNLFLLIIFACLAIAVYAAVCFALNARTYVEDIRYVLKKRQ